MSEYDYVSECLEGARNGRLCAGAETAVVEIKRLTDALGQLQGKLDCSVAIEKGAVRALSTAAERIEQLEAALNWIGDAHIDDMTEIMDYARESAQFAGESDQEQWTPCPKHGKDQTEGEPCEYCEVEADLKQRQEHHIACQFQVTGGLEPCDCPLSVGDQGNG